MTNRDHLISVLNDNHVSLENARAFDDHIKCPYKIDDKGMMCRNSYVGINKINCLICKIGWLNAQYQPEDE